MVGCIIHGQLCNVWLDVYTVNDTGTFDVCVPVLGCYIIYTSHVGTHVCMCDARLDMYVHLTRLHITRHVHIWFKQNLFHM